MNEEERMMEPAEIVRRCIEDLERFGTEVDPWFKQLREAFEDHERAAAHRLQNAVQMWQAAEVRIGHLEEHVRVLTAIRDANSNRIQELRKERDELLSERNWLREKLEFATAVGLVGRSSA